MSLIKDLANGFSVIFRYHPEQCVEEDEETFLTTATAVAIKNGIISKEDAIELIKAQRGSIENGKKSQAKVDSEIQILPSDNSSHRTDSTMEKVEATNVDIKPAGELKNNVRQPGGRDREEK